MHRLTSKSERLAARHIPSYATCHTLTDAAAVYTYALAGKFGVIAYRGTASRPEVHYVYRTADQRDAKVADFLDGIRQRAAFKADLAAKRKAHKAFTRASFKSFLRKHAGALLLKCESHFDGMTDCVQQINDATFVPADTEAALRGLVGRDGFTPFENDTMVGVRVYNCCGAFTVATMKEAQ